VALLALSASPLAVESVRRAEFRDAFVSFDQGSGKWVIGNDLIQYALRLTSQQTIAVDGLSIGTNADPVTLSREPDSTITLDGQTWRLGERDSGFRVVTADPAVGSHFVSLSVRFVHRATTLAATRHYVVYPGVPVVEMWTEFESLDGERHSIRNLNGYAVTVPAGDVDYVLGLDTPAAEGGPFTQRTRQLAPDEHFEFGSTTLSSQQTLPYVSIGNGHRRVFGGLVWSGAWSASFDRRGEAIDFNLGLRDMSAWVGPDRRVEGPHAFLGATWDVPGADIAATTQFVRAGRAGRAFPALTTFNTWFVRGIRIDDETIRRDMDWAAEAGLELFQLDAGWYTHDGSPDMFNFTRGLGSWEVDAERFPRGLSDLAEHARGRGLKFGIWVEPERVGIETVGRPGLAEERFLATQNGQYAPGRPNDEAEDAQICLAHPPARAWVLNRLTAFLDQVQPDNLKWDFNRWMHCTRPDHDHPPDGGNFAHTQALYQLLAALRERYPSLTIENCSQGGHRMDFAMARLTDTAWMDDRTAPSAHVRRNLQGLMRVFPPAYLFSYLMAHADEPIRGTEDLPLMARSRMPGVFGVAADLGQVSEGEVNQIYQEVQLVKALRAFQENAVTYPLTPQRPGPGEWEVVQQFNLTSRASLIFAFANEARDPIRVSLRGIQPDLTYELRSSDRGVLGRLNGADLIAGGLEIMEAPESGAQVLVLEPIISTAWPLQNSRLQFPVPRRSPTKPASSSRP
jgi:alpha-galactosidase